MDARSREGGVQEGSIGGAARSLIATINPILRGWVNYFATGYSSRCFSFVRNWVEMKVRKPGPSPTASRLRLEAVE